MDGNTYSYFTRKEEPEHEIAFTMTNGRSTKDFYTRPISQQSEYQKRPLIVSPDSDNKNQIPYIQYEDNTILDIERRKALFNVQKEEANEIVKTYYAAQKDMNRFDIMSRRELQKTIMILEANGGIRIEKEQFGGILSERAAFRILISKRLYCLQGDKPSVLFVQVSENDRISDLYLSIEKMNARSVNDAFERAGISFGFGHKKETQFRQRLIAKIMEIAEEKFLPLSHGWYRNGDEIDFAYPKDMTWKEVESRLKGVQANVARIQCYKGMQEYFDKDEVDILLTKAMIWLNPWLGEYGLGFDRPIAVITENKESMIQMVSDLRGANKSSVKALTLSPKEIRNCISECSYGIAFFEFQTGRYTMDNLIYIRDKCGEIEMDIAQRKTAIIFAEDGIPDKYAECFSGFIYLSGERQNNRRNTQCSEQFLHEIIQYVLGNHASVINMMKDETEQTIDITGHILKDFICVNRGISPESENYIEKIDFAIKKMKCKWDSPSDSAAICNLFCKALYGATGILRMYNRQRVPSMSEEEIRRSAYYDRYYYYLPDAVFSEICKHLDIPYGAKYVKSQLINAGILIKNGVPRSYNTVHTELISVYGIVNRMRMVKLVRSAIDRKAYFSLQEILEERMDGNPEESGITLGWSTDSGNIMKLASDIMNNSILISGKSGSGKTCTLNILSRRIVEQGGTVLVLSYNDTFTKIEDSKDIRRIKVMSQGLPVALLSPACKVDKSVEDERDLIAAVTEILCNVSHLRARQKRRLREAVKQAVRDKNGTNDIQKLKVALQGTDEVSETVYECYQELLDKVWSNPEMNLFENGKMTILDFSGYSSETQRFLAELVLSVIWRQFRVTGIDRENTLYVVCDEFQMLSVKQNAVLDQMLREGRKYHVAVMLATQTLTMFDASERAIVQQAATQLYFRPSEKEIKSICRYIDANDPDGWVQEIQNLQIGECVALGRFQIYRSIIERPIKMSFRAKNIH
ncbi:MAG: DUF87 domain-containing protein [Lachnospiraceae bacterium]|jgi:Cdc6-like AAA superfamily ATPase|nr:DUF87 domain-containing protein [Lachnospiraceae bacterium]MCI9599166.1 DUF87 domain-containing protein [Lachnospiraceae bacterium]